MLIMGYGINMDVDDLTFAVLDRDQTTYSQAYALELAGSGYFIERPPLHSHAELEQRMRAGDISLALEIPPGFGRDLLRGDFPQVAYWVDGAMPVRADTLRGYAQGIHLNYLRSLASRQPTPIAVSLVNVETRYRYNPDVKSLPAMVPAVIPILLMMIPAMLTALAVVREKELGSITNFYVTPVTRLEFLLGKQLPYVVLGFINFIALLLLAVLAFDVPIKGSLPSLLLGFNVPSLNTVSEPWEAHALRLLDAVLDGGYSARLPSHLERGDAIATSVGTGYDAFTRGDSLFVFSGIPNEARDIDLPTLEAAIWKEIDAIKQTPPSAEELARVQAQVVAGLVYAQDNIMQQANRIGELVTVGLPWQLVDNDIEALQAVTPEQVSEVARRYLVRERLTRSYNLPNAREEQQP